jgi:signal peptidase I
VSTALIVCGHFFALTRVPGLGMFPGLLPGEVVLVARPTVTRDGPQRGELWFGRAEDGVVVGRVAAFSGERIRVDGADLSIDEQPVEAEPLGEVEMRTDVPVPRLEYEALEVFSEALGEMRHLAFHRRGVLAAPADAVVPEDAVFLLADNRSTVDPGDSRQFGPVPIDDLIGRALHVVWSPGDGDWRPRLDRIGSWWP